MNSLKLISFLDDKNLNPFSVVDNLKQSNFEIRLSREQEYKSLLNHLFDISNKQDQSSHLLATSVLSSILIEKQYKKISFELLIEILNFLSQKFRQSLASGGSDGTNEHYKFQNQSLSYGSLQLYILQKIHKISFNKQYELTKKNKIQIDEDIRNHVKCLLQSLNNEFLNLYHSNDCLMVYLQLFTKLMKKYPTLFKNQIFQIEKAILSSIQDSNVSSELRQKLVNMIGYIPFLASKQSDFSIRLISIINKSLTNINYWFLKQCPDQNQFQSFIKNQVNFLNNSKSINQENEDIQQLQNSQIQYESDSILFQKIDIGYQIIEQMIAKVKEGQFFDLNLSNIMKTVELIFMSDQKIFSNESFRTSLETQLQYEDYLKLSLSCKVRSLKFLRNLFKYVGKQICFHVNWIYNGLYFLLLNFENQIEIVQSISKTLKSLLKNIGSEFCYIAQYFWFDSLVQPQALLKTILMVQIKNLKDEQQKTVFKDFMQKRKEKRVVKNIEQSSLRLDAQENSIRNKLPDLSQKQLLILQRNLLKFLSVYIEKGGKLFSLDQTSNIDSILSKFLQYPKLIAQKYDDITKQSFFDCLKQALLNIHIAHENSFLIQDFENFIDQYVYYERSHLSIIMVQDIKSQLQNIKLNRQTEIDNIINLQKYFESRKQIQDNDEELDQIQNEIEIHQNNNIKQNYDLDNDDIANEQQQILQGAQQDNHQLIQNEYEKPKKNSELILNLQTNGTQNLNLENNKRKNIEYDHQDQQIFKKIKINEIIDDKNPQIEGWGNDIDLKPDQQSYNMTDEYKNIDSDIDEDNIMQQMPKITME